MSLERNTDLPETLRNGLSAEQQTMVRGLFNALVYEQNMTPLEASQMATQMLQTSGMVYDGKWNVVKNQRIDGVITKVDDDKRLVCGWASIIKDTEGKVLLDRQNDFIDDENELEKSAYTYVLHSRDGGEMHIRKGVSTMVESVVLTKEKQEALGIPEGTVPIGWWIGFKVNDDRVWSEVKKGGYSGFSVHGTGQRKETKLSADEYTEIEKNDKSAEKPALRVSKRYVELLTKAQKNRKNKIATVMTEFKAGKLKSADGKTVTDPKQAMAIAISEQKKLKKGDKPGHPFRGNQHTSGKGSRKATPSKKEPKKETSRQRFRRQGKEFDDLFGEEGMYIETPSYGRSAERLKAKGAAKEKYKHRDAYLKESYAAERRGLSASDVHESAMSAARKAGYKG